MPHTAADGWSCSRIVNASTCAKVSAIAPVTSVARCITLARCKTNGASGTFIEVQKGSIASATDRTAYSCSAKSFEERAREAAKAKSFESSPVLLIVPANTREVNIPRDKRRSSSGVAPTNLSTQYVHVVGYSEARLRNIGRGSISLSDL